LFFFVWVGPPSIQPPTVTYMSLVA